MADLSSQIKAQDEMNKAVIQNQNAPKTVVPVGQKFYTQYNGSSFITKAGKRLVFANGVYESTIKEEIEELKEAVDSGAEIYLKPVAVIKSDSTLLRDVGGGKASGTGAVSSATMAALAQESNSK